MFGGSSKIPDEKRNDPDYIRNKKELNALDRQRELERAINFNDFMNSDANLNDARQKASLTPGPNAPTPSVQTTVKEQAAEAQGMLKKIMRGPYG